jgi:hypothetical protein
MDDRHPAPTLRIALPDAADHDAPFEPPLPVYETDPEVRRTVEAEHYDEQILAALVFP